MSATVHPFRRRQFPKKQDWRTYVVPGLLWLIFVCGLTVEGFAPRLKIENRRFIMPITLTADSGPLHPDVIVDRERRMQQASGLLTLTGAVSLAIWYRRRLKVALMPQSSHPPSQ